MSYVEVLTHTCTVKTLNRPGAWRKEGGVKEARKEEKEEREAEEETEGRRDEGSF